MLPETARFDPLDENLAESGNRFRSCNGSCVDISNDVFHCGSYASLADHHVTAGNARAYRCTCATRQRER